MRHRREKKGREFCFRKKQHIVFKEKLIANTKWLFLSLRTWHHNEFGTNMGVINQWRLTNCLWWVAMKSQIECNFWFLFLKFYVHTVALGVMPSESPSICSQISTLALRHKPAIIYGTWSLVLVTWWFIDCAVAKVFNDHSQQQCLPEGSPSCCRDAP